MPCPNAYPLCSDVRIFAIVTKQLELWSWNLISRKKLEYRVTQIKSSDFKQLYLWNYEHFWPHVVKTKIGMRSGGFM